MCIVTTIPASLNFFKGQLHYISHTFKVIAISSEKDKLLEFCKKERVSFYYIPMKRNISLINDFISLIRFIFCFKKLKPYIVHGNTPKAAFLSMLAARLVNIPIRIYMCHGLRYQGSNGKLRMLLKLMEKITCSCAVEVLCVSAGVRRCLIEDGICKNEDKLKIILNGSANGIDTSYYDQSRIANVELYRKKLGINNDEFVYCFVGRVVGDKGINELVNAFDKLQINQVRQAHLIIVGKYEKLLDPILKETEEKIEKNPRIHMMGLQLDVRPYIAISDAFILPSYREGFGQVLVEACSLGIPCITTNITGCNEVIQDGINGKIIPPRDEKALYDMMKWFYEHRNNEVKMMAKNARLMVIERYDQHKVWEALLKEYQSF